MVVTGDVVVVCSVASDNVVTGSVVVASDDVVTGSVVVPSDDVVTGFKR